MNDNEAEYDSSDEDIPEGDFPTDYDSLAKDKNVKVLDDDYSEEDTDGDDGSDDDFESTAGDYYNSDDDTLPRMAMPKKFYGDSRSPKPAKALNTEKATTTPLINSLFSRVFEDVIKNPEKPEESLEKKKNKDGTAWLLKRDDLKNKDFSWVGEPILIKKRKILYKSIINAKGVTISIGDFVVFTNERDLNIYVCRILQLYQEGLTNYFHGPCFMLSKDSPLGGVARKNELFYMGECFTGPIRAILALANVRWVDLKTSDYTVLDKMDGLYWRGKLMPSDSFVFVDPTPEEIAECTEEIDSVRSCINCFKAKEKEMKTRVVVKQRDHSKRITSFEYNGEKYAVGSFAFVDWDVWGRPHKLKKGRCKEYEYKAKHPEIYTEFYRKTHTPYE